MTIQTNPTPSTASNGAAVRQQSDPANGIPMPVATTLGAVRLRMANERTDSCLGSNDYLHEAPYLVVVMLLMACSVSVLLIALVLKIFCL